MTNIPICHQKWLEALWHKSNIYTVSFCFLAKAVFQKIVRSSSIQPRTIERRLHESENLTWIMGRTINSSAFTPTKYSRQHRGHPYRTSANMCPFLTPLPLFLLLSELADPLSPRTSASQNFFPLLSIIAWYPNPYELADFYFIKCNSCSTKWPVFG